MRILFGVSFCLLLSLNLLVERSHNLAAWRQQANKQERENKKYVEIISMMSLKLLCKDTEIYPTFHSIILFSLGRRFGSL